MLTLHGHVGFGLPSNSAVKVITQATCVGACARLEQGAVCAGVCVCVCVTMVTDIHREGLCMENW